MVKLADAVTIAGFYYALAAGHLAGPYLQVTTLALAALLLVYLLWFDAAFGQSTPKGRVRTIRRAAAAVVALLAAIVVVVVRAHPSGAPNLAGDTVGRSQEHAIDGLNLLEGDFTSEVGLVDGAQLQPSPTLAFSGSGCPNDQASLTFKLEGHFRRIALRVALDDHSPRTSTRVRVDLEHGSSALAGSTITVGPGASLSSSALAGLQVVTLRARALTHTASECSPAGLKLHVFDVIVA